MANPDTTKHFGVRCTLPADDPFAAPHLVGPNWEAFRWFDTQGERDLFLADYAREHIYSRPGDKPAMVYTKVDR